MSPKTRALYGLCAGMLIGIPASTGSAADTEGSGGSRVLVETMAFPAAGREAGVEIAAWLLADPSVLQPPYQFELELPEGPDSVEPRVPFEAEEAVPFHVWHLGGVAGDFRVRVQIRVPEAGLEAVGEAFLEISRFRDDELPVSTPFLGRLPGGVHRDNSAASPWGGLRPVPDRRFAGRADTLGIYFRLGPEESRSGVDSIRVEGILRRGSTVMDRSIWMLSGDLTEWVLRRPVSSFLGGDFLWAFRWTEGDRTVERAVRFRVTADGLDFLIDPLRARETLAYIATGEERLALESSDEEALAALWERFWSRRDPAPGTPGNEARDLFIARVDEADRRFGGVVPGWRTDQGRIFIRHGEPERIERIPARGSGPAAETWTYDKGTRSYTFEDMDGFGVLRLVGGLRD